MSSLERKKWGKFNKWEVEYREPLSIMYNTIYLPFYNKRDKSLEMKFFKFEEFIEFVYTYTNIRFKVTSQINKYE
jgi:hypothetical protein